MSFKIDRSETELISRLEDVLRTLQAYRPQPVPVPIALFRASITPMTHLAMDPTLGWKDLAQGEVRVRTVPGDHMTMTAEPLVRHLAKALSDELDAVQSS